MASPSPDEITIAITVYDRKTYLRQAILSALGQTLAFAHHVIVVEDCGPDNTLRDEIMAEFGGQITYHRNATRRGLFDNWNACIEACGTRWLNILHDDDFLEPIFLAAMVELGNAAPGRALYFGACNTIDATGEQVGRTRSLSHFDWTDLNLQECCWHDPVCFPAQLFDVTVARELGGFRPTSRYCGDWEMWFKLALRRGAASTNRTVANYREHHSLGRGTTKVDLTGRKYAYVNMQRKRHVAWLKRTQPMVSFDRKSLQVDSPMPTRFLLAHAYSFSRLLLRYNAGLLRRSPSPNAGHWFYKLFARLFTWRFIRFSSRVANLGTGDKLK